MYNPIHPPLSNVRKHYFAFLLSVHICGKATVRKSARVVQRNVQTVSEVEMCKLYQRWGRQAVWPLSKSPTLPLYYKSLPATALENLSNLHCTVALAFTCGGVKQSGQTLLSKETDSRPSRPRLCQDPQHTWAK